MNCGGGIGVLAWRGVGVGEGDVSRHNIYTVYYIQVSTVAMATYGSTVHYSTVVL